jgi:hypothetical protein
MPEQERCRLPIPACTALFRLFADDLVSKSVSIRLRKWCWLAPMDVGGRGEPSGRRPGDLS